VCEDRKIDSCELKGRLGERHLKRIRISFVEVLIDCFCSLRNIFVRTYCVTCSGIDVGGATRMRHRFFTAGA
jgi:hypothetical protein